MPLTAVGKRLLGRFSKLPAQQILAHLARAGGQQFIHEADQLGHFKTAQVLAAVRQQHRKVDPSVKTLLIELIRVLRRLHPKENGAMNKSNKYSAEVRERAVRMLHEVRDQYPWRWKAIESIAPKIGCNPVTLLEWLKRAEIDGGQRPGVTTAERERIRVLEREVKKLRRANEILKTASAFFAQAELGRQLKR